MWWQANFALINLILPYHFQNEENDIVLSLGNSFQYISSCFWYKLEIKKLNLIFYISVLFGKTQISLPIWIFLLTMIFFKATIVSKHSFQLLPNWCFSSVLKKIRSQHEVWTQNWKKPWCFSFTFLFYLRIQYGNNPTTFVSNFESLTVFERD